MTIIAQSPASVNSILVSTLTFYHLHGKNRTILGRFPSCILKKPVLLYSYKEVIPMI